MNYQEFKNQYLGKSIDIDGWYGSQCHDLMVKYCWDCLGYKTGDTIHNWFYEPSGNVIDVYNNWTGYFDPKLYERVENNADNYPRQGAIAFRRRPVGHVAIVDSADINSITVIEQNADPNLADGNGRGGNAVTQRTYPYSEFKIGPSSTEWIGWIQLKESYIKFNSTTNLIKNQDMAIAQNILNSLKNNGVDLNYGDQDKTGQLQGLIDTDKLDQFVEELTSVMKDNSDTSGNIKQSLKDTVDNKDFDEQTKSFLKAAVNNMDWNSLIGYAGSEIRKAEAKKDKEILELNNRLIQLQIENNEIDEKKDETERVLSDLQTHLGNLKSPDLSGYISLDEAKARETVAVKQAIDKAKEEGQLVEASEPTGNQELINKEIEELKTQNTYLETSYQESLKEIEKLKKSKVFDWDQIKIGLGKYGVVDSLISIVTTAIVTIGAKYGFDLNNDQALQIAQWLLTVLNISTAGKLVNVIKK